MTDNGLKIRLRTLLERHEGRAQAITRRELRRLLDNPDDRKLRLLIRELVADGLPVVSMPNKPAGYFVASNWDEVQSGMAVMRSYLIEEARRRRDLKVAGSNYLAGAYQKRLL